jgi:F-type H+-transporting ATPase subunit b
VAQRDALSSALKLKLGAELPISFEVDKSLVAGLEIAVGSYVLRANLRDELEYFSTTSNHE